MSVRGAAVTNNFMALLKGVQSRYFESVALTTDKIAFKLRETENNSSQGNKDG